MTLLQRTALVLVLLFAAACGDAENAAPGAADSTSADSAAAQDASAAALRGTPAAVPDSTAAPRADSARVGVTDFKYSQLPDGTRVFTGTLQNNTGETINAAQIQISLLDADNRRLSRVNIEVYDVPANGTKAFEQPLDSDDQNIKGARVRSVFLP